MADIMAKVSRRGCCDGCRRRCEGEGERDFSSEVLGKLRRGRAGKIEATYSPKYRQARATANVTNV